MTCTEKNYFNEQGQPSIHANDSSFYNRLVSIGFPNPSSAIKYCQNLGAEFGFSIKHETKTNEIIYVFCSHDHYTSERNQPNKTNHRSRLVLLQSEPSSSQWTFRVDHQVEHNPTDENKQVPTTWPAEVNAMIISLIHHETQDIRDAIQRRFPDLIWSEDHFNQHLMEERKRIQQQKIRERVCRMVHLSAQVSAVVAANEELAQSVEHDLMKLLKHFGNLAHLKPGMMSSFVEEEDQSKKRKSGEASTKKGTQCVSIPGFNVHVRTQPLRSASISSQGSRRTSGSSGFESTSTLTGTPLVGQSGLFPMTARHQQQESHHSSNLMLTQQVDDLINLTYHHSIQAPFSPNESTMHQTTNPSFLNGGDFWPSTKNECTHQSNSVHFNNPNTSMTPSNDTQSTCSDPNSNALFY